MDPAAVPPPTASISLRELLMALGESLVEVQAAPAGLDVEIRGVALLDPEDPPAARPVNEVHVEAGARLNGALLQTGQVDELLLYLAPTLLGSGRDLAALGPFDTLDQGLSFDFHDASRVGADLRILARKRSIASPR